MTTPFTNSGFTFPDSNVALAATSIKSVHDFPVNFPPYVPKAVLLAATMNTLFTAKNKLIKILMKYIYVKVNMLLITI
jgi:hypothetical protein